jgi:hypothetical protein
LVVDSNPRHFSKNYLRHDLSYAGAARLSPVADKSVVAKFDGGQQLREVEQRLHVANRLAAFIKDPRAPDQITHSLGDIVRFRLLMIAAGYENGNDASSLRGDPIFKMALNRIAMAVAPLIRSIMTS